MPVVALAQNAIWSPGDEFWFVPSLNDSLWTKKMDWYLNQQMSWAEQRKPKAIPETLRQHLNFEPFQLPDNLSAASPLFVVAKGLLPTTGVIEMPSIKSASAWVDAVKKKWTELGKPAIRVFLPSQLTFTDFSKTWGGDTSAKISVVGPIDHE